jgi:hypothetical protein
MIEFLLYLSSFLLILFMYTLHENEALQQKVERDQWERERQTQAEEDAKSADERDYFEFVDGQAIVWSPQSEK